MDNSNLKLFISYCHKDEALIKDFIKHITPLKDKKIIREWYDRKILAGRDFDDTIFNRLDNADIICLFISADFLASSACKREMNHAYELKRKRGIAVVSIILSPCGWEDVDTISKFLVLPTDGIPVTDYSDVNKVWQIVYKELKKVAEVEIKIKKLKLKENFSEFLYDSGFLSKAHSQKEKLLLDDIFVYPRLVEFDEAKEYQERFSSESLIEEYFFNNPKMVIAGEDQSGKSALCKKFFLELRQKNFIPIYISAKTHNLHGKIDRIISMTLFEEYDQLDHVDDIDLDKIVVIIDDFHYCKAKEKLINDLSKFRNQILTVDDIFSLNLRDEYLIKSYSQFKILQFNPTQRYKLITKWVGLSNRSEKKIDENSAYESIDKTTELVESSLGKIIGSGIMPAYPFYILSIISIYEAYDKPLDQEITSQGYCYQALIYLYLRKYGVKNEDIDTYVNFLTELAFYIFRNEKSCLSKQDMNDYLKEYSDKFYMPIKQETLLTTLQNSQIIIKDSFGNYSFCYPYIYYFFVGKHLAEHNEDNKKTIERIINNLHKNENAYIAVFMSHHSKSDYILDEIILNAMCLFEKYSPATLKKSEMKFFDKHIESIIEESLPDPASTPEKERAKRLQIKDVREDDEDKEIEKTSVDDYRDLAIEIRRSIKTVEVMGQIIKNRVGSLHKPKLKQILKEGINVHLRVLKSYFELIKSDSDQERIVDYMSEKLSEIIKSKGKTIENEKLRLIAREIFWNINFMLSYAVIVKIIHSVGSDKLASILNEVCDNEDSPAFFVVKHGILMWYNKNMLIDDIAKRIDDGFSQIAKKILRFIIVDHCVMHQVTFKDRQKIQAHFKIPSKKLLMESEKHKIKEK